MSNVYVVLKAVVFVTVINYAFMYGIIGMVEVKNAGILVSRFVRCLLRSTKSVVQLFLFKIYIFLSSQYH